MKMCGTPIYTQTKQMDPALELALLLTDEFLLSHQLSTIDIRSLIRTNWDRLAKLAHAIHNEETAAKEANLRLSVRNILALSEDGLVNVVKGVADGSPRILNDFLIVAEAIKRNRS